jgi:hypothetical protein
MSLVAEFTLETIPQLLLQALNNTYTDEWMSGGGVALFSFLFSCLVVFNIVWKFGYTVMWEGYKVDDVPMKIEIPGVVRVEIGGDDTDEITHEIRSRRREILAAKAFSKSKDYYAKIKTKSRKYHGSHVSSSRVY